MNDMRKLMESLSRIDEDYNGWSNRATWLVNMWFSPESEADLERIKQQLEDQYDELPDVMKDFCTIDQIDWDELRDTIDAEEDEDEDEDFEDELD